MQSDVAKAIFLRMSNKMVTGDLSVRSIFKTHTYTNEGVSQELISPMNLIEGVRSLGLMNLNSYELSCLIKSTSKEEFGEAVPFSELEKILKELGVGSEVQTHSKNKLPSILKASTDGLVTIKKKAFDISEFDSASYELMKNLANYCSS